MQKIKGFIGLDDAIEQCHSVSRGTPSDYGPIVRHKQLTEWPVELKRSRKAIDEARLFLERLNARGGLGLDVHDQLNNVLKQLSD